MDAQKNHFDAIVIGSGPGGEGASIKLAKAGKSVAVVEKNYQVGGGCTHSGTIPSKAFIEIVRQSTEIKNSRLIARGSLNFKVTSVDLLAGVSDVIDRQVCEREGFYERNDVEVLEGHARFVDPHSIAITDEAGNSRLFTADSFVIATGSHPYHPDDIDFNDPRIVDSDTILQISALPNTITVYGAGVIGCEYAAAFKDLGIKVNLVNTRERLLEFLDEEISNALSYHMRDEKGVLVRQNEEYERVEVNSDAVVLHLKTGKVIKSEMLLWRMDEAGIHRGWGLKPLGLMLTIAVTLR